MASVGQPIPRSDARSKVTGEAAYSGDLSMKGMLFMKILFAERPHARVKSIDTGAAEGAAGVVAVYTAKDVPVNEYGLQIPDQPVLCGPGSSTAHGDTVRFVASFASCFGPGVTWYVSNPAVAYIVTADSNSVLVKAVSIGTASVVAQANADPDVRAAGLVTVLRSGTLPRNVSLRAGTRVVQVAGATPALEVSVTLLNTTPASIHVAAGPQCPFVSIFADPTGEPMGSLTGAMTCPAEPSVDVAPGDSTVLTRVLPADTLATFPPGTYGVNVADIQDAYDLAAAA